MPAPTHTLTTDTDVDWAPQPNTLTCNIGGTPTGPLGAALALIDDGSGRWLAVHVASRGWDIPGGHADPGESAETAVRRECSEETGLQLGPLTTLGWQHMRLHGVVDQDYRAPAREWHLVLYTATALNPRTVHCDGAEITDIAWLTTDELRTACSTRSWWPLVDHHLAHEGPR